MTATEQPARPASGGVPPARRGADVLVESCIAAGIDTVFGVPGDTGIAFYDALFHRTDQIRHVLTRDERHSAAMADAFARVSNRVAAVEVSSGGGATYAVGGLGEAHAAGIPLLLISSDIHASSRGSGAITEIDQEALYSAVTKWARTVEDPEEIPALVAEALRQAVSGRPGPVALIFPENVLGQEALAATAGDELEGLATRLPLDRPSAPDADIRPAAAALAAAQQPAVLAGSGVHTSGAHAELARLAEASGAGVATTIHGKGAIADAHPWSLGVVGNNGAREYANEYLRTADVVVLVGTRANATDTNSWTGPPRTGTTVIHIDIDADRVGRNFPDAMRLSGDARTVLAQLSEALPSTDMEPVRGRAQAIAASRGQWRVEPPPGETTVGEGQLLPRDVVELANEILPDNTTVIGDAGTPTPNISSYWETTEPGRTAILPRGHGAMGYALPGAIGACFARPGAPVLSMTGDGSFAMACGELETVARLELPILCLQFTNQSFAWIKMLQHLYEGRRYFGVDPGPMDAVAIAEGSGVSAVRVRDLGTLREVLEDFVADPRPRYVDVEAPHVIDYTPPVPAWLGALHGNAARPVY